MNDTIELTFDKSHIVTIGERLYSQSIELIRELVNNSYDADATEVEVMIGDDEIVVKDDGSGMDLEGLRQYFSVGSPEKLQAPRTSLYTRDRVGQFGIGKFASLAAADRFEVTTQKDSFAACVVFDREKWESTDSWHLPLEILSPDPSRRDGTTVVLSSLSRQFELGDVEDCIVSGVPLKAPNFKVTLNGYPVQPRSWAGQRLPILEGTPFGLVHGEVVILPESGGSYDGMGIECRVKGAAIRRETFGIETWGMAASRVRGEINADFLPITSDRTGFIIDAPEYRAFRVAMERVMADVRRALASLSDKKENRRASRALNEAIDRVWHAIVKNPECSPFGAIPLGEPGRRPGGAAAKEPPEKTAQPGAATGEAVLVPDAMGEPQQTKLEDELPARLMKKPGRIKKVTPNAVVKRMKFGNHRIACCLDHFGDASPECFSEGTVIYINRDHPLYHREMKRAWSYTMYISRLLTQEIALMKEPRSAKRAFVLQGKLLRDSFISMEEKG
ncbi:MAG: ATP-binding protein [Pseudomonadota bacterium]